ncbi:hypothetical protein HZH68_007252 [Vespula germanica]|uniref:Uncharacterized protein n=1 Tax=Vespula germanica TaxID=30212 RepID=A0A834N9S2_VESGE|nr:hypothetical protein HZH68_007252 [Vespula germanica]
MEDLREEPELEECEEEEDDNEEKTELTEEDDQEEQDEDNKKDDYEEEEEKEEEEEEEEEEEGEEGEKDDSQEDEVLLKSVRDTSRRMSLIDNPLLNEEKGLLQTNFSVTGINEIKTECIPTINNVNTNASQTTTNIKTDPPKRPMSLDLSVPIVFKKPHGEARFEKVTARLIDPRDNMFKT